MNLEKYLQTIGFTKNKNTNKWEKHGLNTKIGELPTIYMSEETYLYDGLKIKR